MSILGNLFKRGPDALQLADWLANMTEAFARMGEDVFKQDKSSPNMLVCFTLINATHTAHNVLHTAPSVARDIGPVYAELRAYYECLWQLLLLQQRNTSSSQDKISRLYGDVAFRTENTMAALFRSNPNVRRALECATGAEYEKLVVSTIPEYIQGERSVGVPTTGNHASDNVISLMLRIQRHEGLDGAQIKAVSKIIDESTRKAPSMKFLSQFDFEAYKPLPDAFFK